MSFEEAVLKCLSKYAILAGRARPSEFWWFMLLYAVVLALAGAAYSGAPPLLPVLLAATFALTPPAMSVMVRRLHDLGLAGWMLLFLVPVAGQVLLVIWLARPGVPRLNRFGPEPAKRRERMLLFAR